MDAISVMAPKLDGSKMADRADGSAPNDGSSGTPVLGKNQTNIWVFYHLL